jgi:DNA-binding beta-propeller fold protein YncE
MRIALDIDMNTLHNTSVVAELKKGQADLLLISGMLLSLLALVLPSVAGAVDRGIMSVEFLYAIETTGGRGERLREPMDMHYDRKTGELYVADAGHRGIFIYDKNGMFIQKISIDGKEGSPVMVSVDNKGRIYVGHNSSAKISVLDYKGASLNVVDLPGITDVPGNQVRPLYFASSPGGDVYVLKSAGGVVKVDPYGDKHEEIFISGEGAPNMMYGMHIDKKGRFLFTDMRPYSGVIFDTGKSTFHRFGSPGVVYGQIARPAGITSDDSSHIFITSTVRNKVLCYDGEGNFIEEFGGIGERYGEFYMPGRIVSDGQDRLYVLENTLKRIQVFRVAFLNEKKKEVVVEGQAFHVEKG